MIAAEPEHIFPLSRSREQLKERPVAIRIPLQVLDVYEATGQPRIGLFVANNPIDLYDLLGLTGFWSSLGQNFNPFNSQGSFYQTANSIGASLGGGLAWLYDENPLTGDSELTQYEQDYIADQYNESVLGQTQCDPTAHALVEASLGVSSVAVITTSALIAAEAAGIYEPGYYNSLFGRGGTGLFNSNDYLRLGYGWNNNIKQQVFRLAVGSKRLPFHWHYDLW